MISNFDILKDNVKKKIRPRPAEISTDRQSFGLLPIFRFLNVEISRTEKNNRRFLFNLIYVNVMQIMIFHMFLDIFFAQSRVQTA